MFNCAIIQNTMLQRSLILPRMYTRGVSFATDHHVLSQLTIIFVLYPGIPCGFFDAGHFPSYRITSLPFHYAQIKNTI